MASRQLGEHALGGGAELPQRHHGEDDIGIDSVLSPPSPPKKNSSVSSVAAGVCLPCVCRPLLPFVPVHGHTHRSLMTTLVRNTLARPAPPPRQEVSVLARACACACAFSQHRAHVRSGLLFVLRVCVHRRRSVPWWRARTHAPWSA